jgi:hypothetical protein
MTAPRRRRKPRRAAAPRRRRRTRTEFIPVTEMLGYEVKRAAPAPRPGKVKLTDAIWHPHIAKYPLDALGPDGQPRGARWRAGRIKIEQGITVHPTTVTRRLQKERAAVAASAPSSA